MKYINSISLSDQQPSDKILLHTLTTVGFRCVFATGATPPINVWTGIIFDDETEPSMVLLTRATNNTLWTYGLCYFSASKMKIRLWEEDPSLNQDAEYIDSNSVDIHTLELSKSPNVGATLTLKDSNNDADYISLHSGESVYEMYNVDSIRLYDLESDLTLYEGKAIKTSDSVYEFENDIVKPDINYQLKTILCDWNLSRKADDFKYTMTNIVCMFPRFFVEEGYSEPLGYYPLVTNKGNVTTKYPFAIAPDQNSYLFQFRLTAESQLTQHETKFNTIFNDYNYNTSIDYMYNGDVLTSAYAKVNNNNSADISSQSLYGSFRIYSVDETPPMKHGDKIECVFNSGTESDILLSTLTATECVYSVNDWENIGLKSMPPLDFAKPFVDIEFYEDVHESVLLGQFDTESGYPTFVSSSLVRMTLVLDQNITSSYRVYINSPHLWYPELNTIASLADKNSNQKFFTPLIKTGNEKITLTSSNDQIVGEYYNIGAVRDNFLEVNVGVRTYQWRKDGAVIPDQVSRNLSFETLSIDDSGSYTVEMVTYPQGVHAPDSSITVVSEPFIIDIKSVNELTMDVNATSTDVSGGVPITISGQITIETNTIKSIVLRKNAVVIQEFEVDNLNPSYTIDTPTDDDIGFYAFRIEYIDGTYDRVFTSEVIQLTSSGGGESTDINFTVSVIADPVDAGDTATLYADVKLISNAPNVKYLYQWYREYSGSIAGANQATYTIPVASTDNDGNYWVSVIAIADGYEPTIKTSEPEELVVRIDAYINISISSNQLVVADGKTVRLNLDYSSLYDADHNIRWYGNGILLPDGNDKLVFDHINYGDVIYQAVVNVTDTRYINKSYSSNNLYIKGVVAVESLVLSINGPSRANVGEIVTFDSVLQDITPYDDSEAIDKDNYTYNWYCDNSLVGHGSSLNVYTSKATFGEYKYTVISKIDPSIQKTSPSLLFSESEPYSTVVIPKSRSGVIGDTIEIISSVSQGTVESYQWYKDGIKLDGENQETLTIEDAQISDSGIYKLDATVDGEDLTSGPCVVTVRVAPTVDPNNPLNATPYIHDLRPGRDAGFMWMGWWVLDEIHLAQSEGFDWIADPLNPRFQYGNVLKALADHEPIWKNIEIQESRNGYILLLKDLT